jgi:integrase
MVDRRSVVNPRQARALLKAVHAQHLSGPRLVAFFAVLYYAGLRPEEAVILGKDDATLPPLVWDEDTLSGGHAPVQPGGQARVAKVVRAAGTFVLPG